MVVLAWIMLVASLIVNISLIIDYFKAKNEYYSYLKLKYGKEMELREKLCKAKSVLKINIMCMITFVLLLLYYYQGKIWS